MNQDDPSVSKPNSGTSSSPDPIRPSFNSSAAGTEQPSKPPEPHLSQEPPIQKPDFPAPSPGTGGGLSHSNVEEIKRIRLERHRKLMAEINHPSKTLSREFNRRSR